MFNPRRKILRKWKEKKLTDCQRTKQLESFVRTFVRGWHEMGCKPYKKAPPAGEEQRQLYSVSEKAAIFDALFLHFSELSGEQRQRLLADLKLIATRD